MKPDEFAAGQKKEGQKKEMQLGRNTSEARVRTLLATPVLEVVVADAKQTIDDAEYFQVLPSLIDKAEDHTQKACDAQLAQMMHDLDSRV